MKTYIFSCLVTQRQAFLQPRPWWKPFKADSIEYRTIVKRLVLELTESEGELLMSDLWFGRTVPQQLFLKALRLNSEDSVTNIQLEENVAVVKYIPTTSNSPVDS